MRQASLDLISFCFVLLASLVHIFSPAFAYGFSCVAYPGARLLDIFVPQL
jgi:hypothetical protein